MLGSTNTLEKRLPWPGMQQPPQQPPQQPGMQPPPQQPGMQPMQWQNTINMRKKNMSTDHLQYLMCVCAFFSQKMCNSQVIWKLKGHGYYNMPLTWLRAFIFVLFSRLCVDDVFGPRTPNCSFMFFPYVTLSWVIHVPHFPQSWVGSGNALDWELLIVPSQYQAPGERLGWAAGKGLKLDSPYQGLVSF